MGANKLAVITRANQFTYMLFILPPHGCDRKGKLLRLAKERSKREVKKPGEDAVKQRAGYSEREWVAAGVPSSSSG